MQLRTYEHFADRFPLTTAVLERMLAGVSTRYRPTLAFATGVAIEPQWQVGTFS